MHRVTTFYPFRCMQLLYPYLDTLIKFQVFMECRIEKGNLQRPDQKSDSMKIWTVLFHRVAARELLSWKSFMTCMKMNKQSSVLSLMSVIVQIFAFSMTFISNVQLQRNIENINARGWRSFNLSTFFIVLITHWNRNVEINAR